MTIGNQENDLQTFYIHVPSGYSNYTRSNYNITFSPSQLNFWDSLIYFFNGDIEKTATKHYQITHIMKLDKLGHLSNLG
jgi:hypothetical protein